MIRKVAKVQALREVFLEDMQGMYTAEKSGDIDNLTVQPVDVQAAPTAQDGSSLFDLGSLDDFETILADRDVPFW